jgi:hypothetical protein
MQGVYQIAQNMLKDHFADKCSQIPADIKEKLLSLQQSNKRAAAGKLYWVDGLKVHGVHEDENRGLRFRQLQLGEGGF